MRLIDHAKVVEAFVPGDVGTGGSTGATGNYVCMKSFAFAAVVINVGAWAGGTAAVTLTQAQDSAGTGAKALAYSYYYTNAAAVTTDTLVKTAASSTFNLGTATGMYIIEVPATSLDCDNNFDWFRVNVASPGAKVDVCCGTYLLFPGRYAPDGLSALV